MELYFETTTKHESFVGSHDHSAGVWIKFVNVTELSDAQLEVCVGEFGRTERKITALKSKALAEINRRHGSEQAARVAQSEQQCSRREAHRDV